MQNEAKSLLLPRLCSVPYAYLYHTRMVHTIRVYAYGITIRVWYGLLYHTRMMHIRHHWCMYINIGTTLVRIDIAGIVR